MSRRIGLVRHGAHDELGRVLSGRVTDVALNPAGRDEAAALGRALIGGRGQGAGAIGAIHASPQRRTRETAEILGETLGLVPQVDPALDEVDFGRWAGQHFAALDSDPDWQEWNRRRASAPSPGGETMQAATLRAARRLDTLAAEVDGGAALLCVSHCDIIRGVIAHYLGLSLDHILRFSIDPGRVSWLDVDGQGGAQVLSVNARN